MEDSGVRKKLSFLPANRKRLAGFLLNLFGHLNLCWKHKRVINDSKLKTVEETLHLLATVKTPTGRSYKRFSKVND